MTRTQTSLFIGLAALVLLGAGCATSPASPTETNTNTPPLGSDAPSEQRIVSDFDACRMQVTDVYPITGGYAHLKTLGALFTAADCGLKRLDDLFGGGDAMFIASSRVVLKPNVGAATRTVLETSGYRCEDEGAALCMRFVLHRAVPVSNLLPLRAVIRDILSEDCIYCRPAFSAPVVKQNAGVRIIKTSSGITLDDSYSGVRLSVPPGWFVIAENDLGGTQGTYVSMSPEAPTDPATYFGIVAPAGLITMTVEVVPISDVVSPVGQEKRTIAGREAIVARNAEGISVNLKNEDKTIQFWVKLGGDLTESAFWKVMDTLRIE